MMAADYSPLVLLQLLNCSMLLVRTESQLHCQVDVACITYTYIILMLLRHLLENLSVSMCIQP